jgi:YQGE family putative transporter
LLIYSIIISFFVTFINNPTAGIIYWVIHKTPNSKKRRIEGIVVREVYLNIGRVLGVLLLLLTISKNANAIPFIIVCLSLSQIVVWYLFNKVKIE